MSPYLSMAHINPFLTDPNFFGFNPLYTQFMGWNYMMNPTTMMMNGMWNPYIMMGGHYNPINTKVLNE